LPAATLAQPPPQLVLTTSKPLRYCFGSLPVFVYAIITPIYSIYPFDFLPAPPTATAAFIVSGFDVRILAI
jgi:hypothetical protein